MNCAIHHNPNCGCPDLIFAGIAPPLDSDPSVTLRADSDLWHKIECSDPDALPTDAFAFIDSHGGVLA